MSNASQVVDFAQIAESLNLLPKLLNDIQEIRARLEKGCAPAEYLTYSQAARHLKLGVTTMQQWVSAKRVPHYKLGSRVLFLRDELDQWVKARRVTEMSKRLDVKRRG